MTDLTDKYKQALLTLLNPEPSLFAKMDLDIRNDRQFILELVKTNGFVLEFVSDELKADFDIGLAAVTNAGAVLKHATPNLRAIDVTNTIDLPIFK